MMRNKVIILLFSFVFNLCMKRLAMAFSGFSSTAEQLTLQMVARRGLESFCFRTEYISMDNACNDTVHDKAYRMGENDEKMGKWEQNVV